MPPATGDKSSARWLWVTAWRDLGQIGITLCPACAANLESAPSVWAPDGRMFHVICMRPCKRCNQPTVRNEDGEWICPEMVCKWMVAFPWAIEQVLHQLQMDKLIVKKAKPTGIPGSDDDLLTAVQRALKASDPGIASELVRQVAESPMVIRQRQINDLADRAAVRATIIKFAALAHVFGLIGSKYGEEIRAWPSHRGKLIRMIGEIQERHCKDLKRHRRFAREFGRIQKIIDKGRKRLLNPSFGTMVDADATDLRFAQLEIE